MTAQDAPYPEVEAPSKTAPGDEISPRSISDRSPHDRG